MDGQEINNKSRLTLERRHQLIDLNKEYVNFDITFECKAVDASKDFEIIVVNQEQLNTIDLTNLTMKMTKNGYISGNIIADEDRYQNYFLILRSATDEQVDVDLDIKIRQIEPKETTAGQQQFSQPMPDAFADNPPLHEDTLQSSPQISHTRLVFMVLGLVIIGGALGYYVWKNSKNTDNVLMSNEDTRSVYSDNSSVSKKSSSSSSSSDDQGILDTLIQNAKT